ncbi:MAG: flagellar biosynthetic protein FliP, partial [Nitratireductor sp.]|nr:flagellar biosynthetic protein FliP [Nitratireductor sp.]
MTGVRRRMALAAAPLAALAAGIVLLLLPAAALAQDANLLTDLIPEGSATFSGRIIQGIILLTVLSLAPGILITTTC